MKLLINQELIETVQPADKTLLQFVRARGHTGTKEGCASGDCGACTVLVGEFEGDTVRYHTVNACIVPVGQMAGKHVVTVEGLQVGEQLHPAQAEMVNCHGSQCGYCTPGFVMSLAALVEAGEQANRETVLSGISGNLCRCTGYRPIVDAGLKALGTEYQSRLDLPVSKDLLADSGSLRSPSVIQPCSEAELQQALTEYPDAKIIAGGTDLMLEVTQRYERIPKLIDVSGVEELNCINLADSHYVIGAAASYTQLEKHFASLSPQLIELLERLGSRQIRNTGTVGGNLANGSPIADMPPVLIVWDALIDIVSANGSSREIAVTDFYKGYRQTVLAAGEYIAGIRVPVGATERFHRFYKSSKRIEDDISSVMGAFSLSGDGNRVETARVAFGGMAATPVQLQVVESELSGATVTDELIDTVVKMLDDEMSPLTDVRASASYRSAMAGSMLERALREFRGENLPLVTQAKLDV